MPLALVIRTLLSYTISTPLSPRPPTKVSHVTPTRPQSGTRELTPPSVDAGGASRGGGAPWYALAIVPTLGLLFLHLGHPQVWVRELPGWWFPSLGVGLVLVAWLGRWAVLLVAADVLLVAAQAPLIDAPVLWNDPWRRMAGPLWDAVMLALEVLVIWECYYHRLKGSRRLGDPRSAMLFLMIVTASTGLFAFLHALPPWIVDRETPPHLETMLRGFWLSHALGALAVAPPLLATLTPWLVRRRLARPEPPSPDRDPTRRFRLIDVLEVSGLALIMALLGTLEAIIYKRSEVSQWQISGIPLLVVVWASLRQGLRGGTIVASSAVGMQLFLLGQVYRDIPPPFLWQANLLAQCSAALLVAAASNSIRLSEARYRQVVTRIPVVLYSARVRQSDGGGRAAPQADVTFVSPAALRLFPAHPELLLGDYRRWFGFVYPGDREILLAAMRQLSRQGEPVTCEYRLVTTVDTTTPPPGPLVTTGSGLLGALRSVLKASYGNRVISFREPPRERLRWVRDTMAPLFGPTGELEGWDGIVSDITEQRALADDLRRTTSMFHALVANLPAGVFFVQGEEGLPILVNTRARQLLGQREDPAAGLARLVEVYHLRRPDGSSYPVAELPVVAAMRDGTTCMRDDIVVHRPDGSLVPLIAWAAPIDLSERGQHDAAVWVFEDLTTLQQAESARRESEARLRTVFETMAEGVVVIDGQGVITACNPSACRILGLSPENLTGRSLYDPNWRVLREDGSAMPVDEFPAVISLRSGHPSRHGVLGVPSGDTGAMRWLLVNAMPLPSLGDDGAPQRPRVVTTFSDISDYRQALEIVRASEEKYRVLVETLPILLVQFDQQGRATYVNPTAQAISGYGIDDLSAPDDWIGLLPEADLPAARDAFAQALCGTTSRFETRYRAKDGRELVGYVLVEPRTQGDTVVGTTALIVDMTRERQLEWELERAQRLELIGRVSSGIAHDFNNLLTVILTLAELSRYALPPEHSIQEDLRKITYAGEQAANLAHQLLAFSKNKQPIPRRLDVNRVARRTLELLRATLPKSIEITAELSESELPVLADEMQLQQVLMNLCLNARDAMPQGGRLLVRTEADAGPWVHLSVADDGEGIPREVQKRIFDAFFSTRERGTGLGLAMVQQIVEANSGRVAVESHPGEGARFDVWLPRVA